MFCSNCGGKISTGENYCQYCGYPTNVQFNNAQNTTYTNNQSNTSNRTNTSLVLGIISLVGVFLVIFAPISLILSIIGLIIGIKDSQEIKNVSGIITNAIGLFLSFAITAIIAILFAITASVIANDSTDYDWNSDDYYDYDYNHGDYSYDYEYNDYDYEYDKYDDKVIPHSNF